MKETIDPKHKDFAELVWKSTLVHVKAMCRVTCVVNLRQDCTECIFQKIMTGIPAFIEGEHGDNVISDPDQYMRQVVIWAKESTEKELEKPCTKSQVQVVPVVITEQGSE
ncbi:MAG: hypothetical protein O6945_05005 [Gammaproteobacteria bacterium]|nr:hypothetical protein [Gammaproteobacteria bacterium]